MNITVVGMGYVGLSNAVLLSQNHQVRALELIPEKVDAINRREAPIQDKYIEKYFAEEELNLDATTDPEYAYAHNPEYVIIAAPTDYDEVKNHFNTTAVEAVIKDVLKYAPEAIIIIKSTVPVGYTERIRKEFKTENIIFSPEFLREGKALEDNLYPSRVIIGEKSDRAQRFADLMVEGALSEEVPVLLMNSTEAEAVKLFSNTYLALRVAYFNELDTYAEKKGLNSLAIIDGVGLDPRIGDHYNNPSFGYGGYCLPKDTKQLLANYKDVPNDLIQAIVDSNMTRKEFIADQVLAENPKQVGVHRITMKADSDNFRQAAIFDVMAQLRDAGIEVVIYEPQLSVNQFEGYDVEADLEVFIEESDVILANRWSSDLEKVKDKVYTRDLYNEN